MDVGLDQTGHDQAAPGVQHRRIRGKGRLDRDDPTAGYADIGGNQRLGLQDSGIPHDPVEPAQAASVTREKAGSGGAGDGNRTRTASLEGWDFTIELHPRRSAERHV